MGARLSHEIQKKDEEDNQYLTLNINSPREIPRLFEREALRGAFHPDAVFLDVGANSPAMSHFMVLSRSIY